MCLEVANLRGLFFFAGGANYTAQAIPRELLRIPTPTPGGRCGFCVHTGPTLGNHKKSNLYIINYIENRTFFRGCNFHFLKGGAAVASLSVGGGSDREAAHVISAISL